MRARGIDVSHHQAPSSVDWERLASTGHAFAFARAANGIKLDATFAAHFRAARSTGLAVGPYIFVRQAQDADAQMAALLRQADLVGHGHGDLPPALDVEPHPGEKFNADALRARVAVLIEQVRDRFGSVVVYTNVSTWTRLGNPTLLAERGVLLWVAHWDVQEPRTPMDLPWDFWQYRVGPLDGVDGAIDQNVFRASERELPRLGVRELPTDPTPPAPPPDLTNAELLERVEAHFGELRTELGELGKALCEVKAELAFLRANARDTSETRETVLELGRRVAVLENARH